MAKKLLGWVCPNCYKLNKHISITFTEVTEYTFRAYRGDMKEVMRDVYDSEVEVVKFLDCGHETHSYCSDELAVYKDDEGKIVCDLADENEDIKQAIKVMNNEG